MQIYIIIIIIELDGVSLWNGKLTGFQGSHFVCGGEGGMLVIGVCDSMWMCEWTLNGSHWVRGWVCRDEGVY